MRQVVTCAAACLLLASTGCTDEEPSASPSDTTVPTVATQPSVPSPSEVIADALASGPDSEPEVDPDLVLAETVSLSVQGGEPIERSQAELADRAAWVLPDDSGAGQTETSPIELIEWGLYEVQEGPGTMCGQTPELRSGVTADRVVSITAADSGDQSCMTTFAVNLYLNPEGQVIAVDSNYFGA